MYDYKSVDATELPGEKNRPTELTVKDGTTTISLRYDTMGGTYLRGITSLTVPDSVIDIQTPRTYWNMWWERQPDGLVYLGKIFYGYKGNMPANTAIEIQKGTVAIAGGAFSEMGMGCITLTSITIPDSVTNIGPNAFDGCTGLTSVTIPDSVTTIGDGAFRRCTGLTSVAIPSNITTIREEAFSLCTGLTSITIPNSVTSIERLAFNGCAGITSITIPYSVTSIKNEAFSGCVNLTITAPVGSRAQAYAMEYNIPFIAQ